MKKKLTMKHIFIPVAIVVILLAIVAVILGNTDSGNNELGYHTHANGETHYDNQTEPTYHVHDDGVTHWDEH